MVGCMRLKVTFYLQIIISSDPNRGQIQKKILWYNKMLKKYTTKGQCKIKCIIIYAMVKKNMHRKKVKSGGSTEQTSPGQSDIQNVACCLILVSFILIILNIKCTCTILHWTHFYRIHRICRYGFNLKKHISVNVS